MNPSNTAGPDIQDEGEVQVWTVSHWPKGLLIKNGPAPVLVYCEYKQVFARNADGYSYAVFEFPEETVWTRVL